MTYEQFCTKVLENHQGDESVTRKSIAKTAFRTLVIFACLAVDLGYLVRYISDMLGILASIATFVALIFVFFSYVSETKETYDKWAKISKFWWVAIIICVALILLMKAWIV